MVEHMENVHVNTITEINESKIESVKSMIDKSTNTIETEELNKILDKLKDKKLTVREITGFTKEMEKTKGLIKQAVARDIELENGINRENKKLEDVRKNGQSSTQMTEEELTEKIAKLEEKRAINRTHIDDLKMQMKSQTASIKESIAKLMDRDIALSERIKNLFCEQGVTIFSILTGIGMSISVLVEALLPGGSSTTTTPSGGGSQPNSGEKDWLKKKLETLKNLLKKLADKFGAALPGILGSIVSWVFNTLSKVLGAVAQNLWTLFLAAGYLIYDVYRRS